jgi:UDP-GlcNAc:undecaprenyl-phosphate GlcNAc-1-phosphate transferase
MIYNNISVFILSFLCVLAITPLIIKFALKINFVDNPNARKIHKKAIPLLGGLAVFTGFCLFTLYDIVLSPFWGFNKYVLGYLGGAAIIVIVGLIDDKMGMSPKVKMLGQLLSCIVFIWSNELSTLFGAWYITLPVLIFWMVGLMNALNFLDNMDGIISGISAIMALGFYGFSWILRTPANADFTNYFGLLSLTFAGSVLGFLPYNFNPAKIFLGDAGSMFIGYFLSTMGILMGRIAVIRAENNLYYLLPILLLSYAIFDISLVSITRKKKGISVTEGGKDHSTHRIGNAVGSTKITAIFIYLINIAIVLVTILVVNVRSVKLLVISTAIFGAAFLFFGRKLDQLPYQITQNQLNSIKKKGKK